MIRTLTIGLGVAAAVALGGCSSWWKPSASTSSSENPGFELADLMAFRIGTTRYDEVQGKFGTPQSIHRDADGGFRAGWAHTTTHLTGPRSRAVILQFGPDRRLVGTISTAESNTPGACINSTSVTPLK